MVCRVCEEYNTLLGNNSAAARTVRSSRQSLFGDCHSGNAPESCHDRNSRPLWTSRLARVFEAAGCRTQTELAAFLGVRQSSISDAKKRGSIPADWLLTLLWKTWINPIWVLTGQGTRTLQPAENAESVGEVSVPIVVRCPPPDCTTDELVQEIVRRAVRRMAWNEDEVCLIVSDGTCSCATMPKK